MSCGGGKATYSALGGGGRTSGGNEATRILDNVESKVCDYCGDTSTEDIAAPVDLITEAVAGAVNSNFADPSEAGVPYESAEGGYQGSVFDTDEALRRLPFDAHDELFEEISNALTNDLWAAAPGGHWLGSAHHTELRDAWEEFVVRVKHESRYFFSESSRFLVPDVSGFVGPDIFETLADLARGSLVKAIPVGTQFFRVRQASGQADWTPDALSMGAPPPYLASGGRMNPAGISYLYLAFEEQTAIAEIFRGPPANIAIARFKASRALSILDLIRLPELPSIFDSDHRYNREGVLFLEAFVDAISKPVTKDGREHIEFVPSQIVTEYFRLVFAPTEEVKISRLDWIAYPSAIRPGGRNLVLFPTSIRSDHEFEQVAFEHSWGIEVKNWADANLAIR